MSDEQDRVAMLSDLRALEHKFDRLEERIEERLAAEAETTRRHFDTQTDETRRHFDTRAEDIRRRFDTQSEDTRRHFDIVAESIRDIVKPVAELASHHSTVLDDHEHRLHNIEQRGR